MQEKKAQPESGADKEGAAEELDKKEKPKLSDGSLETISATLDSSNSKLQLISTSLDVLNAAFKGPPATEATLNLVLKDIQTMGDKIKGRMDQPESGADTEGDDAGVSDKGKEKKKEGGVDIDNTKMYQALIQLNVMAEVIGDSLIQLETMAKASMSSMENLLAKESTLSLIEQTLQIIRDAALGKADKSKTPMEQEATKQGLDAPEETRSDTEVTDPAEITKIVTSLDAANKILTDIEANQSHSYGRLAPIKDIDQSLKTIQGILSGDEGAITSAPDAAEVAAGEDCINICGMTPDTAPEGGIPSTAFTTDDVVPKDDALTIATEGLVEATEEAAEGLKDVGEEAEGVTKSQADLGGEVKKGKEGHGRASRCYAASNVSDCWSRNNSRHLRPYESYGHYKCGWTVCLCPSGFRSGF